MSNRTCGGDDPLLSTNSRRRRRRRKRQTGRGTSSNSKKSCSRGRFLRYVYKVVPLNSVDYENENVENYKNYESKQSKLIIPIDKYFIVFRSKNPMLF